ncbi:MAG: Uma2 family endonuclease [Caldilineales bacterium]|nr:Uma2 family endonuclease [Caldilineales bacterium]
MTTQAANQPALLTPAPQPAAPSPEAILRRRLLHVLSEPLQPERLTYEEFLAWADEDTLAEWVDGAILMTSPASNEHQDLVRFLTTILSVFVEAHALGVIRPAPFQMKLTHGREPDLLFVAAQHQNRLHSSYLDGPADLVIEIISPESVSRDRGEKFIEYEAGGVPEYWLLDPQRCWAEFYHLQGERYRLAFAGGEGEYHSTVLPGFGLRVQWLWQQPLPRVLDVLRDLGLI